MSVNLLWNIKCLISSLILFTPILYYFNICSLKFIKRKPLISPLIILGDSFTSTMLLHFNLIYPGTISQNVLFSSFIFFQIMAIAHRFVNYCVQLHPDSSRTFSTCPADACAVDNNWLLSPFGLVAAIFIFSILIFRFYFY